MRTGAASPWDAFHDVQRDYGLDDAEGFRGAFDAMVSELIEREPFGIELTKAGLVFEERAVSNVGAALKELFDRTVEPNDGAARLLEEFDIRGARHGAAAKRNDCGFSGTGGFPQDAAELFMLGLTKRRFTELRKNCWNGEAGAVNDAFVEINVKPAGLAREQPRDRGLAASHESGQGD